MISGKNSHQGFVELCLEKVGRNVVRSINEGTLELSRRFMQAKHIIIKALKMRHKYEVFLPRRADQNEQ